VNDLPAVATSASLSDVTVELAAPFEHLLRGPEMCGVVRTLLDGELRGCVPGWPRLRDDRLAGRWLRGSDVLIELAHQPPRSDFELAIALHADSATRVVERLLGAQESAAVASSSGSPSEAECGVLAYVAARLCAASASSLCVRSVRRCDPREALDPEPLLLWPVAVASSFGPLQATLLLSLGALEQWPLSACVSLFLRDRCEPAELRELSRGDLLLSDAWTLTPTTEGLTGDVLVGTAGADGVLTARLARGALEARAVVDGSEEQLELVLTRRTLPLLALARFAAGEPLALAPAEGESASLRWRGTELARGELVVRRGAVGLRIDELLQR